VFGFSVVRGWARVTPAVPQRARNYIRFFSFSAAADENSRTRAQPSIIPLLACRVAIKKQQPEVSRWIGSKKGPPGKVFVPVCTRSPQA
ncbi:MAG TPA: hypothetical protein VM406_05875, partial [Noviherbaspirillum sp.]|nr:hypothetical protein [Noviherbaspirillum sp.]